MRKANLSGNKTINLIFAASVAALLVLITYQGAFDNDFVSWDDYEYVVHNDLVINHEKATLKDYFSTVISLNYHPITILSLSFHDNSCESCREGISAKPFIVWNIILHIFNTILVLVLIYKLSGRKIVAAVLVAILFGIHPMHVESVAWISGRKDVLSSLFFLSGLICFVNYKQKEKHHYLWLSATFLLFVMACLSKAVAVIFPVVLLLLSFWLAGETKEVSLFRKITHAISGKEILLLFPFFCISLLFGLIAVKTQEGGNFLGLMNFIKEPESAIDIAGSFSAVQKIQIAGYGFFTYMLKFLAPLNLGILYPYPLPEEMAHSLLAFKMWGSFAGLLVLAVITVRSVKKTNLYFFGLGFYFVNLILVLHFIPVGASMISERYTYLPYIGLSFIPVMLIGSGKAKLNTAFLIFAGCFIIFMMILARKQVRVWHDSGTLWSQVIDKYPDNEEARGSRGKYYYGLSAEAKTAREKIKYEDLALVDFSEAIKAGTDEADIYEGTAVILESKGDLKKALDFINAAIKIDPLKGKTYYNRAMIYDRLNDKENAISDYSRAINLDKSLANEVLSNRSVLLLETGKYSQALEDLNYLVYTDSRNHMYYFNRAFARIQLGDIKGAMDDYHKVLELNPENTEARSQLRILQDHFVIKRQDFR